MSRKRQLVSIAAMIAMLLGVAILWRPWKFMRATGARPDSSQIGSASSRDSRPPMLQPNPDGRSTSAHETVILIDSESPWSSALTLGLTLTGGDHRLDYQIAIAESGITSTFDGAGDESYPVTVSLGSDEVLMVTLMNLPPSAWVVEAHRIDTGEPSLRSERTVVNGSPGQATHLHLQRTRRGATLFVDVVSEFPVTSAVVTVSSAVREEFYRDRRLTPERGEAESGLLSTTVEVPVDVELTVQVISFSPGASVLGLPAPQQVTLAAGESRRLSLSLPTAPLITFTQSDAAGDAIPFNLTIWSMDSTLPAPVQIRFDGGVVPGTGGRTWQIRLPRGRYTAHAVPEFRYMAASQEFDVKSDAVIRLEAREGTLRARLEIVTSEGAALANTRVNLNKVAVDMDDVYALPTNTDNEGVLTTPAINPGTYFLIIWSRQLTRELTISDSNKTHRLILPAPPILSTGTASLSGSVKLPDGTAPNYRPVYLQDSSGWYRITTTSPDGTFSFSQLERGMYSLLIPAPFKFHPRFIPWRDAIEISARGSVQTRTVQLVAPR